MAPIGPAGHLSVHSHESSLNTLAGTPVEGHGAEVDIATVINTVHVDLRIELDAWRIIGIVIATGNVQEVDPVLEVCLHVKVTYRLWANDRARPVSELLVLGYKISTD